MIRAWVLVLVVLLVVSALVLAARPWDRLAHAAPANGHLTILVTGNCEGTLEACG